MTSRPYSGPTVCSSFSLGSGYICVPSGFEVFIPSGTETSRLAPHCPSPQTLRRRQKCCPAPVLELLLARTELLRTLCVPCFMFHTSDRQQKQHTYTRLFSLMGWLGLGSFLEFHVNLVVHRMVRAAGDHCISPLFLRGIFTKVWNLQPLMNLALDCLWASDLGKHSGFSRHCLSLK